MEYILELFKWLVLFPIYTLLMLISFIAVFGGFFALLDFICSYKESKVLYSLDNPTQFWDTEYFQGYASLVGRLNGKIVIFSNDRSRYKFVSEKEFLTVNPNAYSPDNPLLVWGKDKIVRDSTYVDQRLPVI